MARSSFSFLRRHLLREASPTPVLVSAALLTVPSLSGMNVCRRRRSGGRGQCDGLRELQLPSSLAASKVCKPLDQAGPEISCLSTAPSMSAALGNGIKSRTRASGLRRLLAGGRLSSEALTPYAPRSPRAGAPSRRAARLMSQGARMTPRARLLLELLLLPEGRSQGAGFPYLPGRLGDAPAAGSAQAFSSSNARPPWLPGFA